MLGGVLSCDHFLFVDATNSLLDGELTVLMDVTEVHSLGSELFTLSFDASNVFVVIPSVYLLILV